MERFKRRDVIVVVIVVVVVVDDVDDVAVVAVVAVVVDTRSLLVLILNYNTSSNCVGNF